MSYHEVRKLSDHLTMTIDVEFDDLGADMGYTCWDWHVRIKSSDGSFEVADWGGKRDRDKATRKALRRARRMARRYA